MEGELSGMVGNAVQLIRGLYSCLNVIFRKAIGLMVIDVNRRTYKSQGFLPHCSTTKLSFQPIVQLVAV